MRFRIIRSEEHTSELQSHDNLVCRIIRSEEHTSELQSHDNLVCRLLLEKKKNTLRSEEHTSELRSHDNIVCRLLLEKTKSEPASVKDSPRTLETMDGRARRSRTTAWISSLALVKVTCNFFSMTRKPRTCNFFPKRPLSG